jgi:starvation-inducible DNA-binding protein
MEELYTTLRIALSNTFMMYFRAHSYHWNVEGPNFSEYHKYLGKLYEELHDAVDPLAEELRALDQYAPISLTELYSFKIVMEDISKPEDARMMMANLLSDNNVVLEALNRTFKLANEYNKQGLADFIAGRIDVQEKHGWMLRSYLK